MERTCGGCTACCKTHGIFEIQKMPGEWCPHCNIGKGCKIYGKHPASCKKFKCTWIWGIGDLDCRPDMIEIVSQYKKITGIGIALCLFEVSEGALNSSVTRIWTARNIMAGVCVVHVSLTADPRLYLSEKIQKYDRILLLEPSQEIIEVVPFPESASQFI